MSSATLFGSLDGTSPLIADRWLVTFIAGDSTLTTAGKVCKVASTGGYVTAATAGTDILLGVVVVPGASGSRVTVQTRGIAKVTTYAGTTAGQLVIPDASGGVTSVALSALSTPGQAYPRGVALTTQSTSGGSAYILLW